MATNIDHSVAVKSRTGEVSPSLLSRTSMRPEIASVTWTHWPPASLDRVLFRHAWSAVGLVTAEVLPDGRDGLAGLVRAERESVNCIEPLAQATNLLWFVDVHSAAVGL